MSGVPFFCLIFFAVEITLLSLTELGYFGSFFFGLDVVGTLSIILDIPWIIKAVPVEVFSCCPYNNYFASAYSFFRNFNRPR